MSKKLFVTSDIHSFYDELMLALNEAGFDINNPEHIFVNLGDAFDRGDKSVEVLDFLLSIPKDRRIFIKGNHERLLVSAVDRKYFMLHDYHNKTVKTCLAFSGLDFSDTSLQEIDICKAVKANEKLNEYLGECVNYYILGDNIFLHGWWPYWESIEASDAHWKDACWDNGMEKWDQGYNIPGKTIWCGHWHTSWGHANLENDGVEFLDEIETYYIDPDTGKTEPHVNNDPFIGDGIVAMDACCAASHKLNVKVLEI